jgi:hypothetical protein
MLLYAKLGLATACLALVGCTTAVGRSTGERVEAQLGHGFGKRITIEARVVVRNNPAMRRVPEICLHVLSIEGMPAPADLLLSFTWADLVPENIAPDRRESYGGRLALVPGHLYRLRGYETGEWIGVPAELMGRFPSLDPPIERPFQFHNWFEAEVGAEIQELGEQVPEKRLQRVRFW